MRELFVNALEALVRFAICFERSVGASACARCQKHVIFKRVPETMVLPGEVMAVNVYEFSGKAGEVAV